MNILIIGSGGREHALAWKVSTSPLVGQLYCAPGNPGIARIASLVDIAPTDIEALAGFAKEKQIDLTIVGPEQPLAAGIVNMFNQDGLPIFGPTREAAALETSKIFAKKFMEAHTIPTANFRTFSFDQRFEAERYIYEIPFPIVMKADGLAAGKGVIICESKEQALEALDAMFAKRLFGKPAGILSSKNISKAKRHPFSPSATGRILSSLPRHRTTSAFLITTRGKIRAAWAPLHRRLR